MKPGFVTLHRKFFDHWLWEEKRQFSKAEAWLDLVRMAAFAEHSRIIRGNLITINRGEMIASLRYLGERWGWKKDKVNSFVRLLENQTMTRRETRQGETVIILCNYDNYNNQTVVSSDSEPDANPDKETTAARQSPDSDPTKKNKDNNGKKVKEEDTFAPDGTSSDPVQKNQTIVWNDQNGFEGIKDDDLRRWSQAYPAVSLTRQIAAASEWIRANPAKRKTNYLRFLTNWFSRAQEKGGDIPTNRPASHQPTREPVRDVDGSPVIPKAPKTYDDVED